MEKDLIIKALECLTGEEVMFCRECGYNKVGAFSCRKELAKDALALIKQLTEENERLNGKVAMYEEERKYHFEMSRKRIAESKANTVRAMQEKLHEEAWYEVLYEEEICIVAIDDVDRIAKEMLEGNQ